MRVHIAKSLSAIILVLICSRGEIPFCVVINAIKTKPRYKCLNCVFLVDAPDTDTICYDTVIANQRKQMETAAFIYGYR